MAKEEIIEEREELLDYDSVETWMNSLQNPAEKGTMKSYLHRLKLYCNFVGKDPDALIKERKSQKKEDRTDTTHENLLNEFLSEIEEEHSPSYAHGISGAVRSFYRYNNLGLGKTKSTSTYKTRREHIPSTKEIKQMAEAADVRDRAIILFLFQSGLRVGTVAELVYADIVDDLDPDSAPVRIHIMGEKSKYNREFDTFIGADGVKALNAHFEERRNGSFMRGGGPEKIDGQSPLFRTRHREVRSPTRHTFPKIVKKIALRAGVAEKFEDNSGREYSNVTAHTLRKAWQNRLEEAGVHPNLTSHMAGRKLPGSEGRYSKPSNKVLEGAYEKAEPKLSISKVEGGGMTREETETMIRERDIESLRNLMSAFGIGDEKIEGVLESYVRSKSIGKKGKSLGMMKSPSIEELDLSSLSEEEFQNLREDLLDLIREGQKKNQKLIEQEELENYLEAGWRYVDQNGEKIIVEGGPGAEEPRPKHIESHVKGVLEQELGENLVSSDVADFEGQEGEETIEIVAISRPDNYSRVINRAVERFASNVPRSREKILAVVLLDEQINLQLENFELPDIDMAYLIRDGEIDSMYPRK